MGDILSTVCKKDMCTACGLCVNLCHHNAIKIEDKLHSQNALIDTKRCIKCDKCYNNCPQNIIIPFREPIKWYQGWIDDSSDRSLSSSGGLAFALAKNMIANGGYVASCLLKDGEFKFSITNSVEELYKFRGSKYVKSNPSLIYIPIKEHLKKGNKVLFIGLPCQVAGIKSFVGTRLMENLITVDLICHGSPSQKLLELFLTQYGLTLKSIDSISFRDKLNFNIRMNSKRIVPSGIKDKYTLAFLDGLTYTENCYSCQFAKLERISDITLGDSWGTDLKREEAKGISLALCQTQKGLSLLNSSKVIMHIVDLKSAINNNMQLKKPFITPPKRAKFFRYLEKGKKFNYAVFCCMPKKCFKQDIKRIIVKLSKKK